ncbi:hypothetical protein GCM10017764_17570 [Sphingobacterium griseoflavum]|uniref:Uncharacterized protein n=1 Tax=Sphingobacterium griseoflavum TaxID=1474952 RepID=A0ABQ3HUG1_9SPHI|nr:hypothetical protein GCM10017764_17570 [Sphingobacterium griseoflavum]
MSELKKVRLLKDHHSGAKKGTVSDVAAGRADYLVRTKQAEYVQDEPSKVAKTYAKVPAKKVSKSKSEPCPSC